ncbi:MAG: glycosyltransferase family 4 protein [Anaerolineae bacterium]|nr:glycosyltransferase family 4 protein [Anaerolineae bacterium]
MPHIAIDARLTYYRRGGIPNYMRHLARELPALDPRARYTILYSRKHKDALAAPPDAPNQARAAIWTPCHHRLEAVALGAELLRFRLDLLHSPDFIPPRWGARRYVVTVHDLNFLHYPQFLTAESRRYYNGQIRRAVQQAHHILADSYTTKADLITMLGAPAEKITVHMLGVEAEFAPQPPARVAQWCEQYDLAPGYILFVGTFEPRKNLPGLLRAYRLLLDALPGAPRLVVAGQRGWLYEEIYKLVETLALGERVRWVEDPPYAEMPALYSAAGVLTTPSFYEGFGLPALEAMACGTPAVVADRASLPEVVGEAGLLVDPDDPSSIAEGLRRVLTDPALHARLARAGLARARTFTWRRTAEVVREVYHKVLSA